MPKYARIADDETVEQVIVVEDITKSMHPSAQAKFTVVPDDVEVGMIRNSKGKFDPAPEEDLPELAPVAEPSLVFSSVGFMDLFKPEEEAAIRLAARDDSNPQVAVQMEMFLDRVKTAGSIHLDDPRVTVALAALKTAGIITEARRKKILAGETPS